MKELSQTELIALFQDGLKGVAGRVDSFSEQFDEVKKISGELKEVLSQSKKSTESQVASAVFKLEDMMFEFSVSYNGEQFKNDQSAKVDIAKMALHIQGIMKENHVSKFEGYIMPKL